MPDKLKWNCAVSFRLGDTAACHCGYVEADNEDEAERLTRAIAPEGATHVMVMCELSGWNRRRSA